MKRVRDFLDSEKTPRWWLLAGGAFVILIAFGQNYYFYQRSLQDSAAERHAMRVESKVVEIQQNSIDFQTFANAYVSSILDGADDVVERRNTLIANILAQDAAVDVSRNIIDPAVFPQVSTYRAALRNMKDAVEQVTDVVSLGLFWSAASDLLVARNALLESLEEHYRNTGS